MATPEEVNSARKWLLLQKESQLSVLDEANDVLKAESRQVNVAMVCGRLRTGKSYLMNCLLRRPCFEVSSQARSFTKGVDLSSRLVEVEELGGKKGGPRVAFADLEGQGDKGVAQDLKIATPLLIVSKVVLLMEVCPGGPSSEAILESLQLLMMAGNCISERKARRGLFGCLHIVLRDCAQDEAECRSIIFDREEEVNAETDQHAEAMQRRNDIRKSIEISFEAAPKVWCLPKLAEDTAPEDYRKAREGFVEKIDEIRNTFAQQLSEPKLLNGRPLTGSMIAHLMPELAEAMRSNEPALNPPSLVDRVAAIQVERAMDELIQRADQESQVLLSRLSQGPIHSQQLQKELGALKDRIGLDFASRLTALSLAESSEAATEELKRKVEAICQSLEFKNSELLVQQADKILKAEQTKAERMVGAILLPLAGRDLEAKLDLAKEEVLGALEESLEILTPELAELTKRGVCGHLWDLLEEKRGANKIELRRRRSRLATLSIGPLITMGVALLAIFMAGDLAECQQLASQGNLWLNPRCWRHIQEVNRQKEAHGLEPEEPQEEAAAETAETALKEEEKAEEVTPEEIRMARMAQLHDVEIDLDAKTGIGVTLAGALVLWRRQIFR